MDEPQRGPRWCFLPFPRKCVTRDNSETFASRETPLMSEEIRGTEALYARDVFFLMREQDVML